MTEAAGKYYYENLLANQNITAKTNIVWVADFTTLTLFRNQKCHVFLCVDIHTNMIVAHNISKKVVTASQVIRALDFAINERFKIPPMIRLIIHTDRGTQFSSKTYKTFTEKYEDYFLPSMSRENTPTDNAVAERFMRTFKEHKVYTVTIEQEISRHLSSSLLYPAYQFKSYRAILNKYVASLNSKPNRKAPKGPNEVDKRITVATMLMREPNHSKATLNDDIRLIEIENYKDESLTVASILDEIAARKAELVDKTPFDLYEDNLALKIIDDRLQEIYSLIQSNPKVTQAYVMEAVEPIEDSLTELHAKVDTLLVRAKKDRKILPLRDPLDINLFPLFFNNAGSQAIRRADLKQAQLRIAYSLLYHTGLRINEIREITRKDINNAVATSQLSVIHHKTKQAHIHVLSKTAVLKIKHLKPELEVVFNKYQFQYLFGKYKAMHKKSLIKLINLDLKHTCESAQIPYNIKSHSFRINVIANLLKKTSVQHVSKIIGHKSIQSTICYERYALSKQQIQELLEEIIQSEDINSNSEDTNL
jgi:integrase/recombinase XerD